MFRIKNNLYKVVIILIFIISPLIVFITPLLISTLLFDSPDKISFTSYSKRYIMYFLILIIVVLALAIVYLLKSIIVKLLTIIFTILLCITIICLGTMNYLYLDEQFIEYNPLFGQSVKYNWDDVEHVVHETYNEVTNEREKYIFVFYDGFVVEFQPTGEMTSSMKGRLTNKILQLEVSFEEY